jgi:ACT domain-containing protein
MSIQKVVTAIREIDYEKNFKINGTNIDDCTIEWINGSTPISKDDIKIKMQDIEDNGTAKDQKKASGKQKLKDLGLDDAEIKALTGA